MPTTVKNVSAEDLRWLLRETFADADAIDDVATIINAWIDRGDHVAVYENHDLSSALLGDKQFVSFGSERAQLEVGLDDLPGRLPDIGGRINWRYLLIAVYTGDERL